MEHFGHRQQERGEELHVHLVVAPDDLPHRVVSLVDRGIANLEDARAHEVRVLARGGPHVEPVLEQVELDGVGAEADLRVARRGDVGVPVADQGGDPRHLDDDLVARERGDALVELPDGSFELPARDRVEEILVTLRHLFGHPAQVFAPMRRLGAADAGVGRRLLLRRQGQAERNGEESDEQETAGHLLEDLLDEIEGARVPGLTQPEDGFPAHLGVSIGPGHFDQERDSLVLRHLGQREDRLRLDFRLRIVPDGVFNRRRRFRAPLRQNARLISERRTSPASRRPTDRRAARSRRARLCASRVLRDSDGCRRSSSASALARPEDRQASGVESAVARRSRSASSRRRTSGCSRAVHAVFVAELTSVTLRPSF